MNEIERYLFDLQGFLVVENALSLQQVADLNDVLDQQVAMHHEQQQPWTRFNHLLNFGKPFCDLIDNPRLTPYLTELLGENFRLDHDYVHIIRQAGTGPIGSELHGGGTPYDPCQYYHFRSGQMYNGLTAVAYHLSAVKPGEGGFGCIPGSHKSNLPFPEAFRNLETPAACVQEVVGAAGTAIVFTEALSHGTLLWQGTHERRTLFYKYSPYSSAWWRSNYPIADDSDLSESQRRRLRAPGFYPP